MTRDDIIQMAQEACSLDEQYINVSALKRFANLVAAFEREECAKLCEAVNSFEDYYVEPIELICAEIIRARGQA